MFLSPSRLTSALRGNAQHLRVRLQPMVVRCFASGQEQIFNLPPLGDSISEGTIVNWLKQPQDPIQQDEPYAVVETDKVVVDLKSPSSGVLLEQFANVDDTVLVGEPIVKLLVGGDVPASAPSSAPEAPAAAAATPAPAAAALDNLGETEEKVINLPALGDSISEGTIVNWLKQPQDIVQRDEPYAVIETDKVVVDLKAPEAGVIVQHFAEVDDTVQVGEPILKLLVGGDLAALAAAAPPATPTAPPAAAPATPAPAPASALVQQPAQHGRVPSIRFRHGKRDVIDQQMYGSPAAAPATSAMPVKNYDHHPDSVDPLDLPPMYGRLPPLSEDEMEAVLLGGASP